MENASFVIDLDALPHPEDVRADDLGKWVHIGSPKSYIAVERNKSGHILDVQVQGRKEQTLITSWWLSSIFTTTRRHNIGSGCLSCTIASREGTDWHCFSITLKVKKPF